MSSDKSQSTVNLALLPDRRYLGAGLVFAGFLLAFEFAMPLMESVGLGHGVAFIMWALGSACATLLAIAARFIAMRASAGSKATTSSNAAINNTPATGEPSASSTPGIGSKAVSLALAASIAMTAGVILLVWAAQAGAEAFLRPVDFPGMLFGIGLAASAVLWGLAYSKIESQPSIRATLASLILASLVCFVATFATGAWLAAVVIACCFLGSGWMLFSLLRLQQAASSTRTAGSSQAAGLTQEAGLTQAAGSSRAALREAAPPDYKVAASDLWRPLLLAMLCAFIQGLVWSPSLSSTPGPSLGSFQLIGLVGTAITGLIMYLALTKLDTTLLARFISQLLPSAVAAIMIILPSLDSGSSTALEIPLAVMRDCGFSLVTISLWMAMSASCHEYRCRPGIVFSASIGFVCLSCMIGFLLIPVIGTMGKAISLVLLTAYLLAIAVSIALGRPAQAPAEEAAPTAETNEQYIAQRCDELASQHALSKREAEVLAMLARGYSQTSIANALFISENTARTHTRRIYSKLGVSSRDEVIALFDASHK